jgi:hypothetical protein
VSSPVDVILSQTTVVQPDLVFVDSAKREIVTERDAKHGVPHYWMVEPGLHMIEAFGLRGDTYQLEARLANEPAALPPFPDFRLDPAALWS